MSLNNKSHSQFELFDVKSQDSGASAVRVRQPINDLTLSVENIIVVCIVLMMAFVLFFSFGVERGRRLASAPDYQAKIRAKAEEAAKPFVVEEVEETKITIDASELASESEQPIEEQEIIQVPIEKELTDEQLFTVQVASFKTKSHAQKEAETLGKMGTETFVLPKGSHNIVCVGKFAERQKADQFSRKLKSKYRDLLVRRL